MAAAQGQPGQDLQAQWAEYYRSLGYQYPYGQQAGQPSAAAPSDANPEQKVRPLIVVYVFVMYIYRASMSVCFVLLLFFQ